MYIFVLTLGLVLFQSCKTLSEYPEYVSRNAQENTKKEFTFNSPGEGRGTFFINEEMPEKNNVMFKWSPRIANATLLIKSGDVVLDEIVVKNTDHIKLNVTKYSSNRSLSWFLTVSENDDIIKGIIDLKVYNPPISYLHSLY